MRVWTSVNVQGAPAHTMVPHLHKIYTHLPLYIKPVPGDLHNTHVHRGLNCVIGGIMTGTWPFLIQDSCYFAQNIFNPHLVEL